MKNKILNLIILSLITFSCNTKVDYTNPSDVVLKYRELRNSNKIKESFELIADTCKSMLTLQEYLDYYKTENTIKGKLDFKIEVKQLPINIQFPNYRIFEVSQKTINLETRDTITDLIYYTALNKNDKWKILWTNHIEAAAEKLEDEQKFEDANEILRKTFNYNPLNGYVYYNIGWNNYRLNELDESNLLVKKAIELSPKNSNNYSLQAAIYSSKKMHELAVENYKIALDLSNNMKEKAIIYCNMSNDYIELYSPSTAKDLLYKSLEINPSDAYCYWRIARIFRIMKKQDSSLINFEKAIYKKPMDNYLQQLLYFDYSTELFNEYKSAQGDKKSILLLKAMNYVTKALNLDPENEEYKKLLEEIKNENK